MAARYVRIGQYPDYRDEIRGTLAEILASTANPGTYAAPEDVAGCTLEMGADGKWVGTLGSLSKATTDALYASGALANLATGVTYRDTSGTQYTYSAGVGWVSLAENIRSPGVSVGSPKLAEYLKNWKDKTSALKILSFGDSMAGHGVFATVGTFPAKILEGLQKIKGLNAYGFTSPDLTGSTGAQSACGFDVWPTGEVYSISTGNEYKIHNAGGYGVGKSLKLWYITGPTQGSFRYTIGTLNGGISQTPVTIDAYSATSGVASVALESTEVDGIQASIVGVSGTCNFLMPAAQTLVASGVPGVVLASVFKGGLSLYNANLSCVTGSNFATWLASYAPDVLIFEMKEDDTYYPDLVAFVSFVKSTLSSCEIIIVGSTPVSGASGYGETVTQNAWAYAICSQYGCIYLDLYSVFSGSYAYANANGWMIDSTHRSTAGNVVCANAFITSLGNPPFVVDTIDVYTAKGTTNTPAITFEAWAGATSPGVLAILELEFGYYISGTGQYVTGQGMATIRKGYNNGFTVDITANGSATPPVMYATTNSNTKFVGGIKYVTGQPGAYISVVVKSFPRVPSSFGFITKVSAA